MKTIVLFFALVFAGSLAAAPLSTTPAATASAAQQEYIVNTIRQAIRLPEALKTQAGQQRVLVVFTIDAEGHVNVQEVGSGNQLVKASIARQFEALQFTATGKTEMYSIWLNFSVL
ncbi:MAG: hypothetical protein IM638_10385 [Bacteroidetes bacterium]|nr:hypothetical protein [Bacteroidota bacterium]